MHCRSTSWPQESSDPLRLIGVDNEKEELQVGY